jgi:tRNA pseudouridine55 synthase
MSGHRSTASGLLNINKPPSLTSHDVVAHIRKVTHQRKAGHTGTLDPMATGVLLVCLGQATRLIEYVVTTRKKYRAQIYFGISTETLDADGSITAQHDPSTLTETQLRHIIPTFQGEIEQVPPIFSAIKQGGRPLYKQARAGRPAQVEPRLVTIEALEWVAWSPPILTLDVVCSAGTYIRSLARDMGQAAGTGAHLCGLTRTANGRWTIDEAVTLDELEQAAQTTPEGWKKYLQPLDAAILHLPQLVLEPGQITDVQCGRPIPVDNLKLPFTQDENITIARAYTPAGQFLAILELVQNDGNIWRPKKVFQLT